MPHTASKTFSVVAVDMKHKPLLKLSLNDLAHPESGSLIFKFAVVNIKNNMRSRFNKCRFNKSRFKKRKRTFDFVPQNFYWNR